MVKLQWLSCKLVLVCFWEDFDGVVACCMGWSVVVLAVNMEVPCLSIFVTWFHPNLFFNKWDKSEWTEHTMSSNRVSNKNRFAIVHPLVSLRLLTPSWAVCAPWCFTPWCSDCCIRRERRVTCKMWQRNWQIWTCGVWCLAGKNGAMNCQVSCPSRSKLFNWHSECMHVCFEALIIGLSLGWQKKTPWPFSFIFRIFWTNFRWQELVGAGGCRLRQRILLQLQFSLFTDYL